MYWACFSRVTVSVVIFELWQKINEQATNISHITDLGEVMGAGRTGLKNERTTVTYVSDDDG